MITGAAPYLGGPHTWQRLRAAAPEIEFIEIDPLVVAGDVDLERHVREAIEAALPAVDAIVAHGGAARLALDALARTSPELPVLLVSPMIVWDDTMIVRTARAVLGGPFAAGLLTAYARSKQRKLGADRNYVRRQLGFFVRRDLVSDVLVDEALQRLQDPRSTQAVDRTSEFILAALTPVSAETNRLVRNRRTAYGGELSERRKARQLGATVIPAANGSPMIEDPAAVAAILREMLPARPGQGSGSP